MHVADMYLVNDISDIQHMYMCRYFISIVYHWHFTGMSTSFLDVVLKDLKNIFTIVKGGRK